MVRITRENLPPFIERLRGIPEDRKPDWGKMNRAQLYGHLCGVLNYCMGKTSPFPNNSTFFRGHILKFLLFSGLKDFPHSVPLPRTEDGNRVNFPEATLEELEATFEEYFIAMEDGRTNLPPHPYFGDIGVKGWATFHYRHLGHHLKQFGA